MANAVAAGQLLTIRQLADFLQVSPGTIYQWIYLKKLTAANGLRRTIGGAPRFDPHMAYPERRKRQPAAETRT